MTRLRHLFIATSLTAGGLVASPTADGAPSGNEGYVVEPSEHPLGTSVQHGVDVVDLAVNRLTLTSVIHLGKQLTIPASAASPAAPSSTYTIRLGDSLYGIARRHRVNIGDLLAANQLTLTSVIHPGQQLTIPTTATAVASPAAPSSTYTIRLGDSLYGIARRHRVNIGDLLAANQLTLTSVIHPGQQLTIPTTATAVASPAAPSSTYTIRLGDSLYGIARRHRVNIGDLLTANQLTLTSVIHPGQQLTIPTTATAAAPRPVPSPPATASTPPASTEIVERIIRDVWPDTLEETALAIAWRESRYGPRAQSQCCSGLFQIYYDVHKGWLTELGIDARSDLYDPRTNAEAALALYQRAGGWAPWALASG